MRGRKLLPTDRAGGGTKFDSVDPAEFEGADEDENENQPVETSQFIRSGNIPTGSKFFFEDAQFNEIGIDEFEVYIGLFVEGNMGISLDQFWRYRADA